jgi:hypothetical protein
MSLESTGNRNLHKRKLTVGHLANNYSVFFWNQKFRCCVHKSPPPAHVQSISHHSILLNTLLNVILPHTRTSHQRQCLLRFPDQKLARNSSFFLTCYMCATSHLPLSNNLNLSSFLGGGSPASEIHTSGNKLKEKIQHSEHSGSLKART